MKEASFQVARCERGRFLFHKHWRLRERETIYNTISHANPEVNLEWQVSLQGTEHLYVCMFGWLLDAIVSF